MATERWFVDGWELTEGTVRHWEYRAGTDRTGGLVGANVDVPNRPGQVWRRKSLGPGGFTLSMWMLGANQSAVKTYFEELLRATIHADRMVTWERWMPDGTKRWAYGETIQAVEPRHVGQGLMRTDLEVSIPGGLWKSDVNYAHTTTTGATLPKTLTCTNLGGSTAPIHDMVVKVTGPIASGFQVVDTTNINGVDGDKVTYNKALLTGESITFDCESWAVIGGGGHSVNLQAVNPSGPQLLTIPAPRPGRTPTVQLRGSGGGVGTKLEVTGYKHFLT